MDLTMRLTKSAFLPKANTWQFEAIGTHWQIDVTLDSAKIPPLQASIAERIEDFDRTYSRFRADSLVTNISITSGTYRFPDDAKKLMDFYKMMYELSHGVVTPLIGRALEEAGYDASYSLRPQEIHTPFSWDESIAYNYPLLDVKRPVMLDFGAAGKGYLVDIISELIAAAGASAYCVDGGGDMFYRTTTERTLPVGLENPRDASEAIGVVQLINKAICGSAGNRRAWGKYHHILDPRTLESPDHVQATWVVADTALIADGLTTCLFFMEPDQLTQYFSFEYLIVYKDDSYAQSKHFPGEIFTAQGDQS
jgi:thiamine biosynthesis lipoprotein